MFHRCTGLNSWLCSTYFLPSLNFLNFVSLRSVLFSTLSNTICSYLTLSAKLFRRGILNFSIKSVTSKSVLWEEASNPTISPALLSVHPQPPNCQILWLVSNLNSSWLLLTMSHSLFTMLCPLLASRIPPLLYFKFCSFLPFAPCALWNPIFYLYILKSAKDDSWKYPWTLSLPHSTR